MMDYNCSSCTSRRDRFLKYVSMKKHVSVATLGPDGTTSSCAARYFKSFFPTNIELNIILKDSFDLAYEELKKDKVDFVLLPNAYSNMTYYYWDFNLELIQTFIMRTPDYGIVARDVEESLSKPCVRIATCLAVKHLIPQLIDTTAFKDKEYEIVIENSTKKSLMYMLDGKADLALTNNTSLAGSGIDFISDHMHTEVLWSVFMNKTMRSV